MCYVLENGAVILEWRVPERKDGAKRSTHDGPATKTIEFQSINNMKKVDGCGMECIRMEAGRMEWTASKHISISDASHSRTSAFHDLRASFGNQGTKVRTFRFLRAGTATFIAQVSMIAVSFS